MSRVRVLPGNVADQIAAGEVVERPASIVKELVENALDAGATSITVELEAGGHMLVRVSDDGSGMSEDDATLALERHATSKIRAAADLIGVSSYGFRGEALPAIASVSQFELETTVEGAREGTQIRVRGGTREGVFPSGRATGTTVTVKRLFFNTPARRKFLRSPRSETRAAVQALSTLALARLDVSCRLTSDGRTLVDAPRVASVVERIASLFGPRVAEELIPVEYTEGALSIRGFIQRPAVSRPTGRKAFLFVNGRPFRDPFLVRAAEQGYRTTLPPGTRPTMFLALSLPGDGVDVNVHPSKQEIRFRDRMWVERTVEQAIRAALSPSEAAAVVGGMQESSEGSSRWRPPSTPVSVLGHTPGSVSLGNVGAPFPADLFSTVDSASSTGGADAEILQVFSTYLVYQDAHGITIIDQHSAHERVLYERAMADLTGEASAAQQLLLPLTVDLSPRELEAQEQHSKFLLSIGFEVEPFGGRSVVIHAVPNPHPRFDARRCFEELIGDLSSERLGGLNTLERFAATYACRAAVKAGHELDRQERRQLLRQLFACELPPHDVHGRPTVVQLPRDELERRFGRS